MPTFPDFLHVIELLECPSTNDYLKENHLLLRGRFPLMVIARGQTAGRGRQGRAWYSLPGKGVYATFAFHQKIGAHLQLLSLTAGVAVSEMLQEVSGRDFTLKWPNDILFFKKKIAGILCENMICDASVITLVGIGINVTHSRTDFPEKFREKAISLEMITGRPLDVSSLYPHLANVFFRWLHLLETGRTAEIIQTVHRLSQSFLGCTVTFFDGSGQLVGTFAGIQDDGGLILRMAGGKSSVFYSGEIRQLT